MKLFYYMLVMAVVTYLIRMLPFTLVRKKIESRFFKSFLYYMPYAVLSAMTFPAVLYATGNPIVGGIAAAVACVLAFFKVPMTVVAVVAAGVAYGVGKVFLG